MTQEEKELLLKDLCGRLPYGITIYRITDNSIHHIQYSDITENIDQFSHFLEYSGVDNIKPYLRSMSSMTEEEEADLEAYSKQELDKYADNVLKHADKDTTRYSKIILIYKDIDWYNKNHFDYRGLIPKNLALEASEGMYNN